jgi:hypothetical protein
MFFARMASIMAVSIIIAACDTRKPLVIGLTPNEPAGEISQLLANKLNTDFLVTTRQYKDAAEITEAIRTGVVDLAIIEEPSQATADMHVLSALFPSVLHVLVKPSVAPNIDGNQTIFDVVRGRKVYAGPPGGAGYELVQMLIRQQVFPPRDQFVLLDSVFEAEPDIFTVFGGVLTQEALQRLSAYRLVSLGSVSNYGRGSWAEGVALRSPHIQPFIIPAGLYPNIGMQATLSLSVQSLLVTHPSLSDEAAYLVLQKIEDLMAQIRGIYPLANRMTTHPNGTSFTLASHSGALRYEQREAPGFLERYAELLAFIVTVFLALSSLFIALLRMRKQARKDRIDIYFEQLLTLRKSINDESLLKHDVENAVIELQHTVTQLVSKERINADSAFVGFIELSNQILKESRVDCPVSSPRESTLN